MVERIGIFFANGSREVPAQFARQITIVRYRGFQQLLVEAEFGIGEQHRQLRARERLHAAAALLKLHIIGQIFERAIE